MYVLCPLCFSNHRGTLNSHYGKNILAFYIPNGDLNSQYYLLPNASSRKYNTNGMFWPMEDVFQNRHHFVLVKHL